MALSFCSNLGYPQPENYYPELSPFPEQAQPEELATELFGYHENFIFPENYINPFFDLDELFYSDTYTNFLPYFSSTSNDTISLSPEIFPCEHVDPYPKRFKSLDNNYPSSLPLPFFDGYVSGFSSNQITEIALQEIPAPLPQFQAPLPGGRTENNVKSPGRSGGVSLSAQSVAARERRRKITEKTQELGRLVPGGNKMNTAEMFQAASKYVKFLQAQVRVLELMGSHQETNEPLSTHELRVTLASPTVQEKLYSQEKCLVPKELLLILAAEGEIQSKPVIIEEIDQLLEAAT